MSDDDKAVRIDKDVRENIGRLMLITLGSPDPAIKIQMTAGVLAAVTGTLRVVLEESCPVDILDLFGQILYTMNETIIKDTPDEGKEEQMRRALAPLNEAIFNIYRGENEKKAKKDLVVIRDLVRLKALLLSWKRANETYIIDPSSWAESSAMLAYIFVPLWEIAVRHKLIAWPEQTPFNIASLMGMDQPQRQGGEAYSQQPQPPQDDGDMGGFG